jgi:protein TonB
MMNANNIAAADMLDIVFDGRNKAYGAYQLRRSYNKRLTTAMGAVLFAALLIFCTSMLANGKKKGDGATITPIDLTLTKVKEPDPVIPPPVQEAPPPRQVETIKVTIPNIVPDDQVKPEDMPPPVDDMKDARIAAITADGDIDDGTVLAPPQNPGTGLAVAPVQRKENTDSIYYTVQNPAEFPGGLSAWKRYLERNLVYPENAIEAETQGAIKVQFIVDREGNISDVHAINDLGNGLAEEAVRIIKSGPKWKPAEQNGTKVIYRHIQNITFKLN